MAFQTGTQVNAALGRTDYTPFLQGALQGAQSQARGGELIGQGLAGLGQQVATGIEKYYKKQEEKGIEQQGVEFIKSNVPGIDDKAARAGLKAAGGAAAFVNFMSSQRQSQETAKQKQEVDSLTEILRQGGGTIPSPISNQVAKSFSPSTLSAAREQFLKQSKMEAEINKLNAESMGKPVEGQIMTQEQVAAEEAKGRSITGVPTSDGNIRVIAVKTLAKQAPNVTFGAVAPGTYITQTPEGGYASKAVEGAPKTNEQINREEAVATQERAKDNFGSQIKSAFGGIMQLNKMGAMVNPDNDMFTNLGAKVSSSYLGQIVGGAGGTKVASIQKQLTKLQPLMIAALAEATGIKSTQLNSNAELKFYLDAMADPNTDFYSNIAALDALSKQVVGKDIVAELLQDNPKLLSKVRRESNTLQSERPLNLGVNIPASLQKPVEKLQIKSINQIGN
jgi:hypothetical protein